MAKQADTADDWLLAKMMFNANDFYQGQFGHLAATHYAAEIVYEAAIRTLSDDHPVFAILRRRKNFCHTTHARRSVIDLATVMYGAFGIRPLANTFLFPKGAAIDSYFGITGSASEQWCTDYYLNSAGAFQANYFLTDLSDRGLIDADPPLKNFPFYEDALPIYTAQQAFFTTFVDSYYISDADIIADSEIQAWASEANGPAEAIDFPASLTCKAELVDVLTHVAHLVSTKHHAVNLNQLLTASGVLPINPTSFVKPIPTSKGATELASWLLPLEKVIPLNVVLGSFARPLLAGTNRTLSHMFDDAEMLARMSPEVTAANADFVAAMQSRSAVVRDRSFDEDGLSQGMPFVWRALDPEVALWSSSI